MKSIGKVLGGLAVAVGLGLGLSNGAQALLITGGPSVVGIGPTCMEIGGTASTAPGVPVHSWGCTGTLNQQWIITNGQIQQINNGVFTCLTEAAAMVGAQAMLQNCVPTTAQLWTLTATGELVNQASNLCLDWNNYVNNVPLTMQVCNATIYEQFWPR